MKNPEIMRAGTRQMALALAMIIIITIVSRLIGG